MRHVALVTGGGSGIGRGIALALARRGYDMALVGRRADALEHVAGEVAALGARALVSPADLTNSGAPEHVMAHVRGELGPLDLLVNNAGALTGGALAAQTANDIERHVMLNLTVPILLTQLAQPDLVARGGALVFVASMASLVPLPYTSLYTSTKTGLRGFAAALRYELEPLGVRMLAAYPPATDTAMVRGMAEAAGAAPDSPLARKLAPEAVGERIIAALHAGRRELVWPGGELLLAGLHHAAPWLVRLAFRLQHRRFARMMAATRQKD